MDRHVAINAKLSLPVPKGQPEGSMQVTTSARVELNQRLNAEWQAMARKRHAHLSGMKESQSPPIQATKRY